MINVILIYYQMETSKYVFFFGDKANKIGVNIFSQWFPVDFVEYLDKKTKITYRNAEQYMMAQKALLFGDTFYFKKIMETINPATIKHYGRKISGFDPKIWDDNKFNIVVQGNRLKFGQNPELMKRLLETGIKTIVEASPYDKVWGIGLTAEQAAKLPENAWPGENLLGKALMVVRDEDQE